MSKRYLTDMAIDW